MTLKGGCSTWEDLKVDVDTILERDLVAAGLMESSLRHDTESRSR